MVARIQGGAAGPSSTLPMPTSMPLAPEAGLAVGVGVGVGAGADRQKQKTQECLKVCLCALFPSLLLLLASYRVYHYPADLSTSTS
jgi:hypothetical protein